MRPVIRLSCVAGAIAAAALSAGCYARVGNCCRPRPFRVEYPDPGIPDTMASCGGAAGMPAEPIAAGAGQKEPGEIEPKNPLFQRLGGLKAVEAVVDDFLDRLTRDPRIMGNENVRRRMAAIHVPSLRNHVVDQICQAAGGPCKYTGKTMKAAHQGKGVSTADITALVEDLVKTLTKFKVGKTEQDQLLGVLGPMSADIVEKKM